jgi:hypothetical protein
METASVSEGVETNFVARATAAQAAMDALSNIYNIVNRAQGNVVDTNDRNDITNLVSTYVSNVGQAYGQGAATDPEAERYAASLGIPQGDGVVRAASSLIREMFVGDQGSTTEGGFSLVGNPTATIRRAASSLLMLQHSIGTTLGGGSYRLTPDTRRTIDAMGLRRPANRGPLDPGETSATNAIAGVTGTD